MTTQNGWTKYNESENNNQNSVLFIEKQNVSVARRRRLYTHTDLKWGTERHSGMHKYLMRFFTNAIYYCFCMLLRFVLERKIAAIISVLELNDCAG